MPQKLCLWTRRGAAHRAPSRGGSGLWLSIPMGQISAPGGTGEAGFSLDAMRSCVKSSRAAGVWVQISQSWAPAGSRTRGGVASNSVSSRTSQNRPRQHRHLSETAPSSEGWWKCPVSTRCCPSQTAPPMPAKPRKLPLESRQVKAASSRPGAVTRSSG